MNVSSPLRRAGGAISCLLALACSAGALAQTAQPPPDPELGRTAPIWLGYLVIFVLLIAVMTVSIMPSKRGHQD